MIPDSGLQQDATCCSSFSPSTCQTRSYLLPLPTVLFPLSAFLLPPHLAISSASSKKRAP